MIIQFEKGAAPGIVFPGQNENPSMGKYTKAADTSGIHGSLGAVLEKGNAKRSWDDSGRETTALSADQLAAASGMQSGPSTDYKIVMAHTMSPEDYAKAQEDGFDYSSMDPADIVTIQDRVKAEIAKGGTVIAGYNDDLRDAILEEIPGSEQLADEILQAFGENDLPITSETLQDLKKGWEIASSLEPLQAGAYAFLLDNHLDPTLYHFFLAGSSGAQTKVSEIKMPETAKQSKQAIQPELAEGLEKQIRSLLDKIGADPNQGMADAGWLLENHIPVTEEAFLSLDAYRSVSFPVEPAVFARASANAYLMGRTCLQADLTRTDSILQTAVSAKEYWFSEEKSIQTEGNITARRQLEEIRLSMTAQVNMKLLRSGFAIDTAPMEELITHLKQAEAEIAGQYFPNQENAVDSYRLMERTNLLLEEIQQAPVDPIADFAPAALKSLRLETYHAHAVSRKDVYEKAGEQYEALMTAPRADLGDRISKAFGNVDEILRDLGMETSDANRRCVRILGYNQMEISPENLKRVAEADALVSGVISRMKPAAVLSMIRDGVNPLEQSFDALRSYLDQQSDGQRSGHGSEQRQGKEYGPEQYSQYLYALDQKGEITETEREAYIGIYRLLHQVQRMDGAAIGSVLKEEAMMQFDNLLSAVRTRRFGHLDVKIEDSFGSLKEQIAAGKSITEQIMAAFEAENESDYRHKMVEEGMELLRRSAQLPSQLSEQLTNTLVSHQAEVTPENLLAMEELLLQGGDWYESLEKKMDAASYEKLMQALSPEALPEESFEEAYENAMETMDQVLADSYYEADQLADLDRMRLTHRKIQLAKQLAAESPRTQSRDFFLPMEINGRLSGIHLHLETDETQSDVTQMDLQLFTDDNHAVIRGSLTLQSGKMSGYLMTDSADEVQNLKKTADIFIESIRETEGLDAVSLTEFPVILTERMSGQPAANKMPSSSFAGSRMHSASGTEARVRDTDGSERRTMLRLAGMLIRSRQAASLEA